jgi:hypothetical protein
MRANGEQFKTKRIPIESPRSSEDEVQLTETGA